ncbi:MAG: DUF695 domain-containing protein [Actinomycetales bacterium]|jgi:hypothetical protein|nr:DUF695 domain-containing protein [Leifsonia sp.]
MRLFGKKDPAPPVHPISAFWEWWVRQGHTIDPHQNSQDVEQLSQRVAAIDPGLTWHFGSGSTAEHRLTVSAGGTAEVRPAAQRWLRAAPQPDATWEFRSSLEADPNALRQVLEIAGSKLDLSKTEFRVEPARQELRVHVGVHHPLFPGLPETARLQVTFLVLDWLLGEDDVGRWLGHVEALEAAPVGTIDGDGLLRAVESIAAQHDPDMWTLSQWEDSNGTPAFASFRRALRWIDHPTLDMHHGVHAGFEAQNNGLPADGAVLDSLRRLEDELESLLGSRGVLVGHETTSGRRTFHVYTDGEDQNVTAGLADWARSRHLAIEPTHDPAWRQVRQFTG